MSDSRPHNPHEPEILEPGDLDEPGFARKARRFAGRLPFVRDAVAMWFALRDDATPIWARFMVAGALAYFVMPFDALPDLVAGLGFTDDAAVVLSTLKTVHGYVTDEHYRRADAWLGRPTRPTPAATT